MTKKKHPARAARPMNQKLTCDAQGKDCKGVGPNRVIRINHYAFCPTCHNDLFFNPSSPLRAKFRSLLG